MMKVKRLTVLYVHAAEAFVILRIHEFCELLSNERWMKKVEMLNSEKLFF